MGTETIKGETFIRCECGNLITCDDYQRPCGENGIKYKDMINDLALGIMSMNVEAIKDPNLKNSINKLLKLAQETISQDW